MKKILSIMLAGALIAGVAFADVSFTYTGTAIVGGNSKAFDSVNRNDCFNLEISNDIAGAVADWDISESAEDKSALSLDSYYAWMTFGLPVGNLQITTGKWASRLVNRVNVDAGDLDSQFYEAYKPGVIVGCDLTTGDTADVANFASDIDNLTEKNMSTVLAYTLADVLPGTFMAKFGLVNDDGTYNEDSGDEVTIHSGFVGELFYSQEKLFSIDLAIKNYNEKQYGFGLFFSPMMVEKLSATVGFSMGMYNKEDTYDYSEWGVDLRARYAVTDKLAITTMNNISGYTVSPDAGDDIDDKAMWNMVSANYVAGANISFKATVQNTVKSFNAVKATDCVFAITPVCVIKPTDKATVTCGFDIRWEDTTPFAGVGDVSLPIYFSFAL